MLRDLIVALRACFVTFVVSAVAYPLIVWGIARSAFPAQAEGSLVIGPDGTTVVGSDLVAQPFASARYFHPRPSAVDYKADAAGGSNLGPKNPALRDRVVKAVAEHGGTAEAPVPVDLATASGSGLDPHISPEAARFQVARVAAARGLPLARVRERVEAATERSGAILGAPPRVNVLRLNRGLDAASTAP